MGAFFLDHLGERVVFSPGVPQRGVSYPSQTFQGQILCHLLEMGALHPIREVSNLFCCPLLLAKVALDLRLQDVPLQHPIWRNPVHVVVFPKYLPCLGVRHDDEKLVSNHLLGQTQLELPVASLRWVCCLELLLAEYCLLTFLKLQMLFPLSSCLPRLACNLPEKSG